MTDPREQVKRIRQQEILESFQNSNEPVPATGEVSEDFESVTRETIRGDLKKMRGDRISGKKTSQGWIWWVPTEDSKNGKENVATGDQLRRAVTDLVIRRIGIRILTAALAMLALLSVGGIGIYLMLRGNIWLLPISQQTAILYNYSLMVTTGLVIVFSTLIVLGREWIRKK